MSSLPTSLFRIAAMATLVGGIAFTATSYADTAAPDQTAQQHRDDTKMMHSQKAMEKHVEDRIKTLHDKLDITSAQEGKWSDVAQAMRDNEDSISHLMKERYENRKSMTAVDDLQSYEAIAEAHTDGLKKMIPVFQALYVDMSDDQKKDADEAFGHFEGHRNGTFAKKHG